MAALLPALLAACGPGENDPGPGGVTMEEARALDEAAEMLDERKLPPGTLGDAGNKEQAAAPTAAS